MIVFGKQTFLYILEKHPYMIKEIYLSKEIDKKLFLKISKLNKKIIKLDNKKAQSLAHGGNHQGFLLKIEEFNYIEFNDIKHYNFVLVLVGITDSANIGSIIRSAYSLGVEAIIISGVGSINLSTVARTSTGALFDMPISLKKDTLSIINELKQNDFCIYGADMSGKDVREMKFNHKKALLLGSEGEGLSGKILKNVDTKVSIKMQREFDSLNVAVAAALLCDRMRL